MGRTLGFETSNVIRRIVRLYTSNSTRILNSKIGLFRSTVTRMRNMIVLLSPAFVISQDVAQLIVERTTLINHILPQDGADDAQRDDRAQLVLTSLIDLFYTYVRKAQQPQDTYSWVRFSVSDLSKKIMNLLTYFMCKHFYTP